VKHRLPHRRPRLQRAIASQAGPTVTVTLGSASEAAQTVEVIEPLDLGVSRDAACTNPAHRHGGERAGGDPEITPDGVVNTMAFAR
jgi:hypothetical protein